MNIVIQSNTTLGYLTRRRRNGRLHAIENHPAQRDSSAIAGYNLKVESENTPPQLHSGIYNLEMGHIGPMGFMGRKPVMNNRPAQPDSPAIAGSILGMGEHCHTEDAEHTERVIFTMIIKNIMGYFMCRRGNESKSKMQNGLPQRDSKMILIKEAREG